MTKFKFPKTVRHRGGAPVVVYDRTARRPYFRVVWRVGQRRRTKSFTDFAGKDGALAFAEKTAKDIAQGSQAASLSSPQANDALAAYERLESFFRKTGRRISLLSATSQFAD